MEEHALVLVKAEISSGDQASSQGLIEEDPRAYQNQEEVCFVNIPEVKTELDEMSLSQDSGLALESVWIKEECNTEDIVSKDSTGIEAQNNELINTSPSDVFSGKANLASSYTVPQLNYGNRNRNDIFVEEDIGNKEAFCKNYFQMQDTPILHIEEHDPTELPQLEENCLKCNICSKEFTQQRYLRKHLNLHTISKKYICTVCSTQFKSKCRWENHMLVHEESKVQKFQCNICCKEFNCRANLREHQLLHTAKRKFKCNMCRGNFLKHSHLKEHKMTCIGFDSGEQEFKCALCPATFLSKWDIGRHLSTCTGED